MCRDLKLGPPSDHPLPCLSASFSIWALVVGDARRRISSSNAAREPAPAENSVQTVVGDAVVFDSL